jgi:hypothetical protein
MEGARRDRVERSVKRTVMNSNLTPPMLDTVLRNSRLPGLTMRGRPDPAGRKSSIGTQRMNTWAFSTRAEDV